MTTLLVLLPFVLLACGGEQYTSGGGGTTTKAPAGAYTGILIDAQRSADMGVPCRSALDKWKVVDGSGAVLFSAEDIGVPPGTSWAFRGDDARSFPPKLARGTNCFEARIVDDDYKMGDDGKVKEGTFIIGDAAASEIRDMPNLDKLLSMGRVTILVGKLGQ